MELTLKFSTDKSTRCRICKGNLPTESDKKACSACLMREKQRDTTRRQKRKLQEIESIVPGDLPAKVAKKGLETMKVSDISSV